jgi:tetratricopeptide (TPR) repeat protein
VLDIQTARLRRDRSNADRQHDMAFARNKLGTVLRRLGDTRGALENFRAEYETYRSLRERFPKNTRWKDRMANSLSYLASVEAEQGAIGRAMEHRLAGEALWRELVGHDPNNAQWQRNLATTHMQVAVLRRQQGDLAGARKALAAARGLIEPLAQRDPARATWQVDLAVFDTERARVQLASGEAAMSTAQSAVTRLQKLVVTDAKAKSYLASALLVLGEAQERSGRPAEAARSWQEVLTLTAPPVPQSLAGDDHRVRALIYLGRTEAARAGATALRARGYRNPDLERLCAARGIT